MISKLGKSFQSFDQFGALSQIQFFNSDEKFKTIYGGVLSILIYSLGICYFVYLMVMWQTYQIPPSVTNQSIFNPNYRYYKLNSLLFDFSVEIDEVSETLRSIEKKGKLFTQYIYSSDINNANTRLVPNIPSYGCSNIRGNFDYFDPVCMNLNDEFQTHLNANAQNRSEDTYLNYLVNKCDASDVNCLSQEDQSTIFAQPQLFWRLTLFTQDVNLQTGAIINIPQDHYFSNSEYQNASCYLFDLKIRKATFIIDTGIFFSNEQVIEVVHSIQLTVTQNQYTDPVTNKSSIAFIAYSLDRQEEIIRVTYPKLGQILADLGSIFQAFLLTGLIMNKFNDTIMKTKIEEALLKIYFPAIKLFEFQYNWRGKIESIQFRNQNLQSQDFQSVKQFREKTVEQLRQKLNYFNTMHEISRLQIQLQSNQPKQEFIKLQSLGYKMNLPENLHDKNYDQDFFLEYQDFLDVIYQKRDPNKTLIYKLNVEDDINSIDLNQTPLGITPPHRSNRRNPSQLALKNSRRRLKE